MECNSAMLWFALPVSKPVDKGISVVLSPEVWANLLQQPQKSGETLSEEEFSLRYAAVHQQSWDSNLEAWSASYPVQNPIPVLHHLSCWFLQNTEHFSRGCPILASEDTFSLFCVVSNKNPKKCTAVWLRTLTLKALAFTLFVCISTVKHISCNTERKIGWI